jgi:MFS family permease
VRDSTDSDSQSLGLDGSTWRDTLLRREVVAICLFVFVADTILGMTRPILSLFAQNLGASLTLVGSLSLVVGITQLSSGVIIGAISDRRGRKGVLLVGMLFLGLTSLLFALTTTPYLLLPIQVLLGLGFIGTIIITVAYAADVVPVQERSLTIGLVTTTMGLGYATGSMIGGTVAELWGYRIAYFTATGLAVVGLLIGWRWVPRKRGSGPIGVQTDLPVREQLRVLLVDPLILAVCVGALAVYLAFGGMVVAFFPIYAHGLGVSRAAIGTMFAVRALASTAARLPGSALATRFSNRWILPLAMLLSTTVAFILPQGRQPLVLALGLIGEGVAYGVFMTISQDTIAGRATESSRGAALGMYGTATSLGGNVLPFFLGLAADAFGIRSIFYIVGSFLALGTGVMAWVSAREK